MAHNEKILRFMSMLMVATTHDIAVLMASLGIWKAGPSAVNNSRLELKRLASLGKLVEEGKYFRIPSCRSSHGAHSKALTRALVEILRHYPDAEIAREHLIPELNRRADALVVLSKDGRGTAFWLEIVVEEPSASVMQKFEVYRDWNDRAKYFSQLFQTEIPFTDFVVEGDVTVPLCNLEIALFPERNA